MSRPRILTHSLLALLLTGCLRTSVLVQKFNSGAIDSSSGDPQHAPKDLRREIAQSHIQRELIDAYFGQSGADAPVADWLQRDAAALDDAGAHPH